MKRFICASLAAIMMFSSTAFAADANVFIGDKLVEYTDQAPIIINERTYIPIRDVFEALNFEVDWNAESKIVELSNDYYNIMLFTKTNTMLTVDSTLAFDYNKLENEIQIVNGRTMLPLREILESANYSLGWDAETKSAIVNDTNDYTALDAEKAKLESLFDTETQYQYDPSKPSEELTEEEYAFIDNILSTMQELQQAGDTFDNLGDIDEMTPEQLQAASALVKTFTSKFSAVEAPESLKGLDKNLSNLFENIIDNAITVSQIIKDNPDEDGSGAGFTVAMLFVFGVAKDAVEAMQPLNDLAEKKNLDLESIFGEKYSDNMNLF
ncbi:MAG: copper amine oxidase N-terminal domain-containing protein [Firmicutes bacterium]|nr:copper amine oxidase N-terminal domain-containing protein [Bacillota bacterium]